MALRGGTRDVTVANVPMPGAAWPALCLSALCAAITLILPSPAVSAPAAPARVVSSGPLVASVTKKPWSLSLLDADRRPVLRERPGLGVGPSGTLGFRIGGAWKHATRVTGSRWEGHTWIGRLDTTDPGRGLEVELSSAGNGVIRLRANLIGPADGVEALGISFRARPKERYLGFGERSDKVDQRGQDVENWVGEGPYQAGEYPIIANFVPAWGMRDRMDATYFPMPWLLSTAGYGVLVDNTEPSYFRLGTDRPDSWSLELARDVPGLAQVPSDAPSPTSISIRFFAGPRPADVLRRMTGRIGRQPAPAPWFLGPWVQLKGGDQKALDDLRAADVPTSVAQTYTHYLPCGGQRGHEQEHRDRTALYHDSGIAITTYFNPMLCTSYQPLFDQLSALGQITADRDGNPYEYNYLGYHVGQFDFSSPGARQSYGALLNEALDQGYDGWMEDFGEYTPPDAISSDGTPGMVMHNRYPRDYHCAAYQQTKSHQRPVLRFIRSGYTGTAACAPVVWGGDPSTGWGFDGLRSSIQEGLSMGLSGVGVWGPDIGGFFSIFSDALSSDLLSRWVQFAAFSGVMRNESDGLQIDGRGRPQILDPDQIANWRRYAKIRTQLYPYIRAAAADYRRTGMPIMRDLTLQYPQDAKASAREDQYMFGPDLLVSPVIKPRSTDRSLYLPNGRWINLWRSVDYLPADGSLRIRRASIIRGSQWRTIAAPPSEIPVMVRAGSLLTTLPAGVDTLTPFGSGDPEIVHPADNGGSRNLLAFPQGSSRDRFEQKGHLTSLEGHDQWELKINDWRTRTWHVQASLQSLRRPFPVRCLLLDGRALPRKAWTYRSGGRVLDLTLRPRHRRLKMVATSRNCGSR